MMIVMLLLLLASTTGHLVFGSSTHASGVSHQRQPYCIETERQALLTFKQGLEHPHNRLQSWTSNNKDCCKWEGIRCDNLTNHIIMLHLLPHITHFDIAIGWYSISGEISASLVQLQYLEYLNLSYNGFTKIPKFIGAFTNLKYLDFSHTSITGNIPSELGNLTKLRYLDFSHTSITGNIPSELGNLTNLRYLDFSWNSITGNIPSELGNLTNLRILDLSNSYIASSSLTANSFKWLSHLSYLRIFKLDGTNFSKAKDWFHSFKTAPSLSTLHLHDCEFPELDDSSVSHITNSTNSITTLDVSDSTFGSTTVSRLLNLSNNLVDLSLYDNNFNIKGNHLPDAFDNLKYLRHLYLRRFDGEVPKSIGSLCRLQELDLSYSDLNSTIIDILESLLDCNNNSLEILDLSENRLIGPLPRDLSRFLHLRELDVSNNKFSDTLPESIGNLSSLELLDISYNLFTGVVSETHIWKLSSLELLDISNNLFTGVVSETHIGKLSKLKHLGLSSNSLTLKTNTTWVPPFQLQYIDLGSCMIGPQFPSWLQTQSNISYIDLSSSGISDVIPEWFFNMTSNLEVLDLSSNLINSTLPDILLESAIDFYSVDLSSNQFHGHVPLNSLFKADELNLSNNTLIEFDPLFCNSFNGTVRILDLSNNQIFGSLPDCWFRLQNLEVLYLNNNRLSGVIPNSIASLDQIQTLILRNNNLSGTLPSSMKNCTQLVFLDVGENNLEGTIPMWIGETLTDLVILHLKSNHFHGTIPSSLCHLQRIQILDISRNNIYGAIPSCINNFTSMVEIINEDNVVAISISWQQGDVFSRSGYYMKALVTWKGKEYEYEDILGLLRVVDLSSNRLTGEIPRELTNLLGLVQLNLSWNNLNGAMPQKIGNLSKLESLDLSHNNFTGKIPIGLGELSFLAYLNLSYNHLSGRIPTGTQLQSFNAYSYVENDGLCGAPLSECPGDHLAFKDNPHSILDQERFDMSWFYIGLEVGFAFGFIGVCGALYRNYSFLLETCLSSRCLNTFGDWLYVMISIRISKLKRFLQR